MVGGYLFIGMTLGVLLRLVRRYGVSWGPRHLLRLLLALQAAFWASVVAFWERRRAGQQVAQARPRPDPVIIVSPWRTGTSLLQQLMASDARLFSPTYFHCTLPDSFLTSEWISRPILGRAIRGARPMDNVQMGFDEPTEEEYALFRMTGLGPLARLLFPGSDGGYFLDGDLEQGGIMLPGKPEQRARWEEAYRTFMAKLHLAGGGRRVLLKNPFNGPRIPALRRLFPEARFVHIQRDPLDVVPSTVRLWTILGGQNTLHRQWRPPTVAEVVRVYGAFCRKIEADLAALPEAQVARLRYADLDRDPRGTLAGVYRQLDLDYTEQLDRAVAAFQERTRGYKKNRHRLAPGDEALIREQLAHLF